MTDTRIATGAERLHEDSRRATILAASMQVCARYGFRKTSMQDIARAAGMSRPALYQHYANKEAIFRAGVEAMFGAKIAGLRDGLERGGTPTEVLTRAVVQDAGSMMQVVLNSPHGEELMLASKSVAGDIIADCAAQIVEILTAFFARHGATEPEAMAETFEVAKLGLVEGAQNYQTYETRLRHLCRAFGALLDGQGGQPPVA